METEKLYYQDAFLTTFTAQVLSCEPVTHSEKSSPRKAWKVVLDRTAFYPEGGGQPADHGTLNGNPVLDVHEKDGVIFHIVENSVETGENVLGAVDWTRRFDHTQQHSGEHILSGILCADYHCDNVGFHMGAETVTIDYNTDLTWEQVLDAERKANLYIWEDHRAEISYPSREALSALQYRSKKEIAGQVRIVSFPGADCCACCGTHVQRAGQVGLVKVLSCQKFKGGVRLEILCGQRAMRYLGQVYDQDRAIGQALSVKPLDTLSAVSRLTEELEMAKQRQAQLETQLFSYISWEYTDAGDVLLIQPPMRSDAIRRLADAVAQQSGGLAAVFAGDSGNYAYALVRTDKAELGSLVKALNQALRGRGGGRNGFAQGSVQAEPAEIQAFFQTQGAFSCNII